MATQAIPETLIELLEKKLKSNEPLRGLVNRLFKEGRVKIINLARKVSLTVEDLLSSFESLMDEDRAQIKLRATRIYGQLRELLRGISPTITIQELRKKYREIYGKIKSVLTIHEDELSRMRWPPGRILNTITELLETFRSIEEIEKSRSEGETGGAEDYAPEDIAYELVRPIEESDLRLFVCYLPDPIKARQFVSRLIDELFTLRKKSMRGARVLVVLDEAQEFIPDRTRQDDFTAQSNTAVERLLRQGRKYRIHGWISTQRVAHLNVNALQQLHSYFAGTLPRGYDRHVIAEASGVSPEILDKTALLSTGEWLFVSHTATKRRNIPVFIRAPNNEEILVKEISKIVSS